MTKLEAKELSVFIDSMKQVGCPIFNFFIEEIEPGSFQLTIETLDWHQFSFDHAYNAYDFITKLHKEGLPL